MKHGGVFSHTMFEQSVYHRAVDINASFDEEFGSDEGKGYRLASASLLPQLLLG